MTTLERFAKEHRLKTRLQDGEIFIPGKQGEIYVRDEEAGQLAVMFLPGGHRAKMWGAFRRSAEAAGMRAVQIGDSEGCLEFDHRDKAQVKLAIKIAKVRAKRKPTPEQVASFMAATRRHRFAPGTNG